MEIVMKKVRINTLLKIPTLESTSVKTVGFLNKNRLVFYDAKVRVVIDISDSSIHMRRIHPEYMIEMTFDISLTKEGIYDIKCDSVQVPLSISTSNLEVDPGHIHIEYNIVLGGINQGKYIYDIMYEVIE